MKFADDGADVPDDLVRNQERGDVVFICGAGVSMPAGMPTFRGLVEQIYVGLAERWEPYPAENAVMAKDGVLYRQYDRVIRILERRLAAGDATTTRLMKKRILDKVEQSLLAKPGADLKAHNAILNLSVGKNGLRRVVTTNFDTLFERAHLSAYGHAADSSACQAMPRPGSAEFGGMLHLHGRLKDEDLGLIGSSLVLTSAEFGDAYLREGWASRFIYDLARTNVLVLVGYSAEDPPMRYLMEALEADRERYPDLKWVYAFDQAGTDPVLQAALWRAKGIEPILYPGCDSAHEALYSTLTAWSSYANDPFAWRKTRMSELLSIDPSAVTEDQIAEIGTLMKLGDVELIIEQIRPDPAWVRVFREHKIALEKSNVLGAWAASQLDREEMVVEIARSLPLKQPEVERIESALGRWSDPLPPNVAREWELIIRASHERENGILATRAYYNERRNPSKIQLLGVDNLIGAFRPRLSVRPSMNYLKSDDEDEYYLSLVYAEFDCELGLMEANSTKVIWSKADYNRVALLRRASTILADVLWEAADLGYDRSSQHVASISDHPQNSPGGGFTAITRIMADVWEAVATENPTEARFVANEWSRSKYGLELRLHLFALANSQVFAAAEAVTAILGLSDEDFWSTTFRRETIQLMLKRWHDLSLDQKNSLLARVINGPSRQAYGLTEDEESEQWEAARDYEVYIRLQRLEHLFDGANHLATAKLGDIATSHPGWQPPPDERHEFSMWHATTVGLQGDIGVLKDIPIENLVSEALRFQVQHRWEQGDLWRRYCQTDPHRALDALIIHAGANEWNDDPWSDLLWAAGSIEDPVLQHNIGRHILEQSNAGKQQDVRVAVPWLRAVYKQIATETLEENGLILRLWDMLSNQAFEEMKSIEAETLKDPLFNSVNSPGGVLTWLLIDFLNQYWQISNGSIPSQIKERLERAIQTDNKAGLLARIFVVNCCPSLFSRYKDWTIASVLPWLRIGSSEFTVLWRVRLKSDRPIVGELFEMLSAEVLLLFKNAALCKSFGRELATQLVLPYYRAWTTGAHTAVTQHDVKAALQTAGKDFLQDASWRLWRWMSEISGEEPEAQEQRHRLIQLVSDVWPLDSALRTGQISGNLARFAFAAGSSFKTAVDVILPVIVPHQIYQIAIFMTDEPRLCELITSATAMLLSLLDRLIDQDAADGPIDLRDIIDRCVTAASDVQQMPEYHRLSAIARRLAR